MEERKLTFGETLVGKSFNPGGNPQVDRVKELCAEVADILDAEYRKRNIASSPMALTLFNHAIGEVLNAQMNVVKVLTLPV